MFQERRKGKKNRIVPEWLRMPIAMLMIMMVATATQCYFNGVTWSEFWQMSKTKQSLLVFAICAVLIMAINYVLWRIRQKIEMGEKDERR